jgi:hypothetical protein
LELLGGNDGHHPEAALVPRRVQVGPDGVELAVVPSGAVWLLQWQHGNGAVLGEAAYGSTEPVGDLLEPRRRWQREPEMVMQEAGHLAGHLEGGDVRVQIEPVRTLDVQCDMGVKDVVDVHHRSCHSPAAWFAEGGLCRPEPNVLTARARRGRPGGAPVPLPLKDC